MRPLFDNIVFLISVAICWRGIVAGKKIGGKKGAALAVTVFVAVNAAAKLLGIE